MKEDEMTFNKALFEINRLSAADRKHQIRDTFYLPYKNAFERGD